MREKFGRRIQDADEPRFGFDVDFEVESYLAPPGRDASSQRFDANTYLYLTRVMDYFDPFADAEAARGAAARRCDTRFLVVSFDTDWRFATEHSRDHRAHARAPAEVPVTFHEIALAARPRLVPARRARVPPHRRRVPRWRPGGRGAPTARAPGERDARCGPTSTSSPGSCRDGSRVLDLGCGDGALLEHLIARARLHGHGVERSRRGLPRLRRARRAGDPRPTSTTGCATSATARSTSSCSR